MTVGLLPLEKIPIFVWGTVLAVVGGALALHADGFSWELFKAITMLALGLAAVVYDLVKRNRRLKQSEADERQKDATSKQE